MKKLLFILSLFIGNVSFSQDYFPANSDIKTPNKGYTAFTNAIIYISANETISGAVLLIKDTKIVAVGKNVNIPKNSKIVDLKNLYIYPSFIDIYSDFGISIPKNTSKNHSRFQWDSYKDGYYWNEHLLPETDAFSNFNFDNKKSDELLKLGFGVVNTHVKNGIIRGTSLITVLNKHSSNNIRVISTNAAQHFGFTRNRNSKQSYPNSLMGKLAILRQFYKDAEWFKTQKNKTDISLQAHINNQNLPAIFEGNNKLNALRISKLSKEINQNFIVKGGGNELERIEEIKATNQQFIIPINFPKPYDVSNPYAADKIALSDLRFWKQAPSNPAVLQNNNIKFALTTADLKSLKEFKTNLLSAMKHGLEESTAMEALTTIPAKMLGKENEIGSLKKGAFANFLVTSHSIFDKKNVIYENWTQGSKNVLEDRNRIDLTGIYKLKFNNKTYELSIEHSRKKITGDIAEIPDSIKIKVIITYNNSWLTVIFKEDSASINRLTCKIFTNEFFGGKAIKGNGKETTWHTVQGVAVIKFRKKSNPIINHKELYPITFPNIAYGFKEKPKLKTILIKNVTVWTNEKDGILKNQDVLLKNGKISSISTTKMQKTDKNIQIIDGTGKHLTSGIIDEHSHIAISNGVNESGQNNSAEVTIQDVVRSDDINIYRNLSGGVTTSQLLHGSANPIGGRAALIKLKWGESPENMQIKSHKFIKFALGENVKHSRTPQNSFRFPQTRMGVEQVFIDNFTRAKEYDLKKKRGEKVRYDQELEVLAEILNKERFITCHSYVQSEITMLMRVAEKFDFKVNTFTHILEGYKVADKMKKHGAGASTFSDWWAYKFEVNDAIPYNAAILHKQGITVALNSDDAEMSRRLNQEAAKAVKYGGVSEEEAWKFVTLNPAILLHIDDRVGSIKKGKDADVVLWNANPLSIYAKVEKTIIEGIIYFDYERDLELQKEIKEERNYLINKMIEEKNKGIKTQKPKKKLEIHYHCDTENHL